MGKETVGWVYRAPLFGHNRKRHCTEDYKFEGKKSDFILKVAGQGNFELSNPAGLRGFGVASTPSSLSRGGYKPTIEPILREIERAPLTG